MNSKSTDPRTVESRDAAALRRSFDRFLNLPRFDHVSHGPIPTQDKPIFLVRPIRTLPNGQPHQGDLDAVVRLSHFDRKIGASTDLTLETRERLYRTWFSMSPLAFALLERVPADRNGVSIIGNTAILPLSTVAMERVLRKELEVICLGSNDFASPSEQAHLLLDTWVLHNDYKWGQESDPILPARFHRYHHFGFGNVLVLKHLGVMWNQHLPLQLYIEPDATSMLTLVPRLGFSQTGSKSAKKGTIRPFLVLHFPPLPQTGPPSARQVLQQSLIAQVIDRIRHYRAWWPNLWPKPF
jgi:hypothetical protein